jgi:hypothetical protein
MITAKYKSIELWVALMIKRWPIILLIVLPVLIYWPLTFAGRVLYWGLPLYQFYPWHSLVAEAIRSGHLPLWTDLLGNGAPLLANHQSAVFYPFNLIYLALPVEQAMGYSVVLHLVMAGLFAYAWGRTIQLSRFGASVTGLTFMLSAFFVSRTQFITIVNGAAWLPLLFGLTERLVRRRTGLDMVWLSLAVALQFLAGHAQLWFYSLWAVLAYGMARAWSGRRVRPEAKDADSGRPGARLARVFVLLAGAILLSLGLSALQLLPTAELSLYSQRAAGLDLDDAMVYSFWPWRLLTLPIPDLFGSPARGDYWGYAAYWEDAGYVGVLPWLLGLGLGLSLFARAAWEMMRGWLPVLTRHSSSPASQAESDDLKSQKVDAQLEGFLVAFYLMLILVSLVLAMGRNTPIYPLVFKFIPGFGAFRAPARFLLFYTFGISTLAGMGAERFRLTYRAQYVARLTVAGAAAMLAVALAMGWMDVAIKPTLAPAVARFAILLGLSACILLLYPSRAGPDRDPRVARSPLPSGVWQGLVIGFIAADLALFAAPLTPTISPTLYRTMTDADRFLLTRADDERLFATDGYDYDVKFGNYLNFSDWGPSDLVHWLSFRETLVPNLNLFTHTSSVNNEDPLVVGRWRELVDALHAVDWPDRLRLLRMMHVGYVLSESPPPGLSQVETVPHLYRLSDSLPRAWLVPQARLISAPQVLLSELVADTFDPTTQVLLESLLPRPGQAPGLDGESDVPALGHPVSTSTPSPPGSRIGPPLLEEGNSRTIDLVVSQPGYLVLAYTYYPGWRAEVDGRPTELLRANYMFMALPLEPGEHRVTLRYRPVSLILGAFISGLSLLLVVGMVVLKKIQKSATRGD